MDAEELEGILILEGSSVAWLATAWRRAEARAGFGDALAAACAAWGVGWIVPGVGGAPGADGRNMLSMVGRRAAPKGVERKSDGRSIYDYEQGFTRGTQTRIIPLIQSGIELPVKKPTTSFVNELQLKSRGLV